MDLLKNNVAAGVGLAVAAAVLAPILLPPVGRAGRPLAKSLVRGAMQLYDKGREVVAVAGESMQDIMAEIRAENAVAAASPGSVPVPAERRRSGDGAAQPHPEPASGNGDAQAAGI